MRVAIITQEDPFYLPKIFEYLLPKLKESDVQIVTTIVFSVSPFGVKKGKLEQLRDTLNTFGVSFTLYYTLKYLKSLFKKSLSETLFDFDIAVWHVHNSINNQDNISKIKSLDLDLIISIAGNQIFKKQLIDSAKFGIINLHSALLPKYRGLMPSFWVLANNEIETGVSVFFVDEGIDSGPVIVQKKIEIKNQTQEELIWQLKYIGAVAIVEACVLVKQFGFNTPTSDNEDEKMTYYSKPTSKDVQLFRSRGKRFF